MREIKFRAWYTEEAEPSMFYFTLADGMGFTHSYLSQFAVMQYTGLKDKNGKEIYEGDIVDDGNGSIGKVEWRHSGFEQNMINTTGWWVIQERGKVIGNIYENKELLK